MLFQRLQGSFVFCEHTSYVVGFCKYVLFSAFLVELAFHCEGVYSCDIQGRYTYLVAALNLGQTAMSLRDRMNHVDVSATKAIFVSAVHFATSMEGPSPLFGDDLRTSAQEQVEYMLGEDKDIMMVMADEEVKSVVRMGVSKIFCSFEMDLSSLLLNSAAEYRILQRVSDLEWMCNVLAKMNLMKNFVSNWASISGKILGVVDNKKLDHVMWGLKVKLIEITGKVLEAVGYGNVILSAPCRVQLLRTWLPYVRKMKPLLDSKAAEETGFSHKMDEDLSQGIEGAIVSLVLTLPSSDQAEILGDWIKSENQVQYPDLSEAFEVWCYRTKAANRRLMQAWDNSGDTTFSI